MENQNEKKIFFLLIISCILIVIGFFYVEDIDENDEFKIGISVYIEEDAFVNTILDAIQQEVQRYNHTADKEIVTSVLSAGGSQREQNLQIEQFFALDYDVVCINLVDRTNASQMIDAAQEKGIRLIFFNREPVKQDIFREDNIYYVGTDPKEVALQQGIAVVDYYEKHQKEMDKNGDGVLQYVILEGETGHQDSIMRSEYTLQTIENRGIPLQKLDEDTADWFRSRAEVITEDWIRLYGDKIELVLANNDEMALGAIDALKKKNIKAAVFGVDATEKGKKAVKDGSLCATIDCNAKVQGICIFNLAKDLLRNEQLDKEDFSLKDGHYIRVDTHPFPD